MRIHIFAAFILISIFMTGCDTNAGTRELIFNETNAQLEEVTYETIHMNNCGGAGEVSQVAEKSKSVNVEYMGAFGVDKVVVNGELSVKYGVLNATAKKIELVAPAGSNMEFNLKWTQNSWVGYVAEQGKDEKAKYEVSVPISVELIDTRNLGCDTSNNPPANPTSSAPTEQTPQTNLDGWVICWHGKFEHEYLIAYPEDMIKQGLNLSILLPQPWGGGAEYLPNDSLKMCLYNDVWYGEQSTPWFPYASYIVWKNNEFLVCQESPSCGGDTWTMKTNQNPPYMQGLMQQPTGSDIQVLGYK